MIGSLSRPLRDTTVSSSSRAEARARNPVCGFAAPRGSEVRESVLQNYERELFQVCAMAFELVVDCQNGIELGTLRPEVVQLVLHGSPPSDSRGRRAPADGTRGGLRATLSKRNHDLPFGLVSSAWGAFAAGLSAASSRDVPSRCWKAPRNPSPPLRFVWICRTKRS
jgi:hypothetical protein